MLGNIQGRKVSSIATVSTRFAFNDERYDDCTRNCKELSHKAISLTKLYFTAATLYKAPLDEEFCTSLLVRWICLLSGEVQNFDGYRTKFHSAVFAFVEKVKSAATDTGRPIPEVVMN